MEEPTPRIPIGLIEAVLTSALARDLMAGHDTHMPALHFVGELVPFTQDASWIREIVAGYLPVGYAGNTLEEVSRMVSDSLKKGYNAPKKKSSSPSAAQVANAIISVSALEIFHTPQNVAFVAITELGAGTTCFPVRSEAMKGWVRLRYHRVTGKTLGRDALTEVLDLLEAKAIHDAPEKEVHVRLSGSNGDVYYDLGQAKNPLVRISPNGWSLEPDGPPRFYRPDGFNVQVAPQVGGDLNALRDLLHLDDKNWVLLLAFMIICLKPTHPYMVLLLSGGHGSGKSMISELVKRIIDPNALQKSRLPKDEHTLAIQGSDGPAARLRQHLSRKVGHIRRALCNVDRWRIQYSQILHRRRAAYVQERSPGDHQRHR